MTLLYDSDDPDAIPDGVAAAGYIDGYAAAAWLARGWTRFPAALRIAVFAADNGDVLDVESGDATPDQAPAWVLRQHAAGRPRPWVYVNRSNRPAVTVALMAAGIGADQVLLWVATDDGTQLVEPGFYPVVAVQYANPSITGHHYDLSIVDDAVFGAAGGSPTEDDMFSDTDRLIATNTSDRIAAWLAGEKTWTDQQGQTFTFPVALPDLMAALTGPGAVIDRLTLIEQKLGLENTTPPGP